MCVLLGIAAAAETTVHSVAIATYFAEEIDVIAAHLTNPNAEDTRGLVNRPALVEVVLDLDESEAHVVLFNQAEIRMEEAIREFWQHIHR